MKRFFAALLVCVILASVALPMAAFATEDVPSIEQKGDADQSPKTGDTIIYVPMALAATFAIGGVVLYATAERKQNV